MPMEAPDPQTTVDSRHLTHDKDGKLLGGWQEPHTVSLHAELPDPPITKDQQVLVYYPGDGAPLILDDKMSMEDLDGYLSEMQMRTFMVRVCTWADRLEKLMEHGGIA